MDGLYGGSAGPATAAATETSQVVNRYMKRAIAEARAAAARGEVPVGAVVVDPFQDRILAAAGNEVEARGDATAHAELLAIQAASVLRRAENRDDRHLHGCDVHVTLEPCPMCAQAMAHARVRRLYFGAYDPKGGGVEHGARVFAAASCHHRPEVYGGLAEAACAAMMKCFFRGLRTT